MAKDLVYQAAKNALIKDNWLITHDLYTISFGGVNMAVDLGAEKLIAATKDHQKIAVEIKSFLEGSSASHLYNATAKIKCSKFCTFCTRTKHTITQLITRNIK